MSVSKYAYTPEFCDNDSCVGDCDLCSKRENIVEKEDESMSDEKKYTYQVIFRTERNGDYLVTEAILFELKTNQKLCVDNNISYDKSRHHGKVSFNMNLDVPKEK